MKIEANTLQEAFQKAAEQLNCSVTELDMIEILLKKVMRMRV